MNEMTQNGSSGWWVRSWRWCWLDDSSDKYAGSRVGEDATLIWGTLQDGHRMGTLCVCICHRNGKIKRRMEMVTAFLYQGCTSFLMAIRSLGVGALNLRGNDTMSMAEWVCSEVISTEAGLVLLLIMIHYSTISRPHCFCHRNLPVRNSFNPDR